MHFPAELVADRLARGLADLLQLRAALAEHDRLLAVALDEDLLVDDGRSVLAVLPFLGLDRRGVGEFGVELEVELFAGDFGRDHAVGGVAELVGGVVPRAFWHGRGEIGLQVRDAVAGAGRNHEYGLGGEAERERLGEGEEVVLFRKVDLVEDEDQRLGAAFDAGQGGLDAGADFRRGVDHEEGAVGILGAFPRGGDHGAVEAAVGLENPRRVDQDQLRVAVDGDAHEAGAGGLRLGRDDRDLLADERVDEGRLARIGRAEDRDEAAFLGHFFIFSRRRAAAAVSASCLLAPSASASPPRATVTRTRKVGAWWAPMRARSS